MDETTARSLGDKLATLDLTGEEAALLTVLLGGAPADDVQGFADAEPPDAFIHLSVDSSLVEGLRPIVGRSFNPNLGLW